MLVRGQAYRTIFVADDGWTVAKYLLEFERGGGAVAPGLQVVAASEPDADNLRVVVEVAPAAPALAAVAIDRADTLVRAQRRRRWLPYLLEQLRTARPLRKWLERQEEKRTAGRHASARALLQALYGAQGGQRSTLGPAVLTGRTLSS